MQCRSHSTEPDSTATETKPAQSGAPVLESACKLSQFLERFQPTFHAKMLAWPRLPVSVPVSVLAKAMRGHYLEKLQKQHLDWGISVLVTNLVELKSELNQIENLLENGLPGVYGDLDAALAGTKEEAEPAVVRLANICSYEASMATMGWWKKCAGHITEGLDVLQKDLQRDEVRLSRCREKLSHCADAVKNQVSQLEYRCLQPQFRFHATDSMGLQDIKDKVREHRDNAKRLEREAEDLSKVATELSCEHDEMTVETEFDIKYAGSLGAQLKKDFDQEDSCLNAQELCNIVQAFSWRVSSSGEGLVRLSFQAVYSIVAVVAPGAEGSRLENLNFEINGNVDALSSKLIMESGIEFLLKGSHPVTKLPQILTQINTRIGRVQTLLAEVEQLKNIYEVELDGAAGQVTVGKFYRGGATFSVQFKLQWCYPFGKLQHVPVMHSGEVDSRWVQEVVGNHPAHKGLDRITCICTALKGMCMYRQLSGLEAL